MRAYPNHFSLGRREESYSILPDCTHTMPPRRESNVVFPTPDGPVIRHISPEEISKERSSKRGFFPKLKVSFSI